MDEDLDLFWEVNTQADYLYFKGGYPRIDENGYLWIGGVNDWVGVFPAGGWLSVRQCTQESYNESQDEGYAL